MQTAVHTTSHTSRFQFYVLFAALYPLLLAIDSAGRLVGSLFAQERTHARPVRSVLIDARDNASIAISYAVWARKTLQAFVRENRAERLS
jgi:hypothetical protein